MGEEGGVRRDELRFKIGERLDFHTRYLLLDLKNVISQNNINPTEELA